MMTPNPLVSIIMPAYNRATVITSAIQSIRRQTYTNWELIVIDDRSTDNTKEVIEGLISEDSRIHYVVNERRKGASGARNFGMLRAKGELIAFLDSDDQWFEYHLQDSLDTIQRTQVDACFALWVEQHGTETVHNFDNEVEQDLIRRMRTINGVVGEAIVFSEPLLEQFVVNSRNFFQLNTMVFKKELLQDVGLINEELYLGEDTIFLIQFFDACKIALITKPHAVYNQSPDSVYFFCNRWELNPDSLYQNKVLLDKFVALGLESIQVRIQMLNKVLESKKISNKKQCIDILNLLIAKKYYTISYLCRTDREKGMRYCRASLKYKFNIFSLLLLLRMFLSIKGGNNFLKRPLDLW